MRILIAALLTISIISIGCARNTTDKSTTLTLSFTINTRGNINTTNYNYIIAFSTVSTPNVIFPGDLGDEQIAPLFDFYFTPPGREFLNETDSTFADMLAVDGITPYYEDYFDTWSDYIIIDGSTAFLYQSGSTGFDETTTDNLTYDYSRDFTEYEVIKSGSSLTIQMDVSILESDLSGTRYFRLASLEMTDGSESGYLQDVIENTESIAIETNAEDSSDTEQEESLLNSAADIVGWRVEVF